MKVNQILRVRKKMISRAKLRGKKLDEDCKRCYTSSHEYGQMMIEFSAMDWLTIQLMNLLKNAKTVKHMFSMQHHWSKET